MDQAGIDELVHELVAQSFDVERAPAGKVQQRLLALRWAYQATGAARDDLVGQARDGGAAFRAGGRHDELARAAGPLFRNGANDLRYHVARAAHDDGVADAQVAPADFVLVVQRHIGHRGAADEHGLEPGHRRDRAGAADLHVDRDEPCRHLFGREFVRNRPARLACPESQRALHLEAVDLVDDAVDFERQVTALGRGRPRRTWPGPPLRARRDGRR